MTECVLITGAAGGIGRATAEHFNAAGWRVFAADIRAIADLEVEWFEEDVSDPSGVARIFDEVRHRVSGLDALVNNAAVQITKPLVETTPDEWDRVMAVNVRSAYLTTRAGFPVMKGRNARIVNVASVHAVATSANMAAYAASKGAIMALTRATAIELAPHKIRVNALLPGAVDTDMLRAGLNRHDEQIDVEDRLEQLAGKTVMGKIGTPEEMAQAIFFLASDQSAFMTGQALIVDGGATARLSTE